MVLIKYIWCELRSKGHARCPAACCRCAGPARGVAIRRGASIRGSTQLRHARKKTRVVNNNNNNSRVVNNNNNNSSGLGCVYEYQGVIWCGCDLSFVALHCPLSHTLVDCVLCVINVH